MKGLVDDLLVTCEETEGTPNSVVINGSNEINYWVITVFLLVIACFLKLVTIGVKYYMQCGLTIPCLL